MIISSKRLLDFGTGFYLTSDFEQEKKRAVRTAKNREDQYIFKTNRALECLVFLEVMEV